MMKEPTTIKTVEDLSFRYGQLEGVLTTLHAMRFAPNHIVVQAIEKAHALFLTGDKPNDESNPDQSTPSGCGAGNDEAVPRRCF